MSEVELKVAHSPDSDDAFMFYALATGKLDTGNLRLVHIINDIETLNKKAFAGEYEVTAISFHAYAYVAARYALLSHGASMGDGYGPTVISKQRLTSDQLKRRKVATPGKLTTACLALKLLEPEVHVVEVPFDQILPRVAGGEFDAGVIIHEGQLTYGEQGLHQVVDLGRWWLLETGLPLPLGGNVIRKDLPPEVTSQVSRLLKQSIQYALAHRKEALTYAMQFARDMTSSQADQFVGMYVNDWTLDYGTTGRDAVRMLLQRAYDEAIIPSLPSIDFVH